MGLTFLDKDKPLHTCSKKSCTGCDVENHLVCHFDKKKAMRFIAITFPPIVIGLVQVALYNALWLIPLVLVYVAFFGFIEIRVMCSHCPHYAEPGLKKLKCSANYGAPKLWKYRPGPMSVMEKLVFFTGLGIVFFYPLPFFFLKSGLVYLILLGVYAVTLSGSLILLKTIYCSYCMNFACPLNRVDQEIREKFFDKNPVVKEAWKGTKARKRR